MKLTIRKATADDIDAIYHLSSKVHLTSYAHLVPADQLSRFTQDYSLSERARERRFNYFLPRLNDPQWHIYVAELGGRIVGYTKEVRVDEHTIVKKGLFVDPEYQGRGIGGALFRRSLSMARPGDSISLTVIESNTRARRLYEKYGFSNEGYSEGSFYGAKLVTMRRTIS